MDHFCILVSVCVLLFGQSATADTKELTLPVDVENADGPTEPVKVKENSNRGKLLYENHCLACHDSVVHMRSERKANNMGDIRNWVVRWSVYLKLDWDAEAVDDVTGYVNQRFYQFTR